MRHRTKPSTSSGIQRTTAESSLKAQRGGDCGRHRLIHGHSVDLGRLPMISCLMSTASHTPRLSEALEMFLQQDYPCKELVIANDDPARMLHCDIAHVRVLNYRYPFRSLGEKRNALVLRSRGIILANWDDRGLYLPWHLTSIYQAIARSNADFNDPATFSVCWTSQCSQEILDESYKYSHPATAYSYRAWEAIDGYPDDNDPDGTGFLKRLHESQEIEILTSGSLLDLASYLPRGDSVQWDTGSPSNEMPWEGNQTSQRLLPAEIGDAELRQQLSRRIKTYRDATGDSRGTDANRQWLIQTGSATANLVVPSGCGGSLLADAIGDRYRVLPVPAGQQISQIRYHLAFVRNPYARLVNLFCRAIDESASWPAEFKHSFECFLRSCHTTALQGGILSPSVDLLRSCCPLRDYDVIGKIEQVDHGLQAIARLLDITNVTPQITFGEESPAWQAYYTPELAQLVSSRYWEDFHSLGYSPEIAGFESELPFISCVCPTYKRPHMLRNSLACFLAQDYPKDRCELIILDDAGQYRSQSG